MKVFHNLRYDLKKNRLLILMILPAILFFLVFSYLPMGGIVIAFQSMDYQLGVFSSPWVGFDNFRFFFLSGNALHVTMNTILYNTAFIVVGLILQISLAIFLSELGGKTFRRFAQGAMFLPYFISWVVVSAIVFSIFNYNFGTLNLMLKGLGMDPFDFYGTVEAWPAILVALNAWKYVGYGTVVYLAAIMSIDTEMYEAADIDGANIFQKIRTITLPSLRPTIIVLLLLSIGNIFRGDFNMFYQLVGNNGTLLDTTDVIDTFVFRSLLFSQDFGMSAAAGLYQSVLCFTILIISNHIIRKVEKDYALF